MGLQSSRFVVFISLIAFLVPARPQDGCPCPVRLPEPPSGKIKSISASGTDCSSSTLQNDGTTASLAMPNFAVSDTHRSATCDFSVDFEVPKGYRVARLIPSWTGMASAPDGEASVTISSRLSGARTRDECRRWTKENTAKNIAIAISPVVSNKSSCSTAAHLDSKVSMKLKGSGASVAISNFEVDASYSALFQLEPCP